MLVLVDGFGLAAGVEGEEIAPSSEGDLELELAAGLRLELKLESAILSRVNPILQFPFTPDSN